MGWLGALAPIMAGIGGAGAAVNDIGQQNEKRREFEAQQQLERDRLAQQQAQFDASRFVPREQLAGMMDPEQAAAFRQNYPDANVLATLAPAIVKQAQDRAELARTQRQAQGLASDLAGQYPIGPSQTPEGAPMGPPKDLQILMNMVQRGIKVDPKEFLAAASPTATYQDVLDEATGRTYSVAHDARGNPIPGVPRTLKALSPQEQLGGTLSALGIVMPGIGTPQFGRPAPAPGVPAGGGDLIPAATTGVDTSIAALPGIGGGPAPRGTPGETPAGGRSPWAGYEPKVSIEGGKARISMDPATGEANERALARFDRPYAQLSMPERQQVEREMEASRATPDRLLVQAAQLRHPNDPQKQADYISAQKAAQTGLVQAAQMTAAEARKRLSDEQAKGMQDDSAAIGTLAQIKSTFSPKEIDAYMGVINKTYRTASEAVAGTGLGIADPDRRFEQFNLLNNQLKKTAFATGGKALTAYEASILMGIIPTGDEKTGSEYVQKVNMSEAFTNASRRARLYAIQTPPSQFDPTTYDGILRDELKRAGLPAAGAPRPGWEPPGGGAAPGGVVTPGAGRGWKIERVQ